MLNPKYARLMLRLGWLKLRFGRRLVTDGMCGSESGAATSSRTRLFRLIDCKW